MSTPTRATPRPRVYGLFDPAPLLRQVELTVRPVAGGFVQGGPGCGFPNASKVLPTDSQLAEVMGVSRQTVQRWRHGALIGRYEADRVAVRCGFHPANLWPDWYSLVPA